MTAADPSTADRLQSLAMAVEAELRGNILPFWLRLQDPAGGFFGEARGDGSPVSSALKGAVQQARILWAFSSAYQRYREPALLTAAEHACHFITQHVIDPNSSSVCWATAGDGGRRNDQRFLYAQAFAILGLATFHRASGERDALDAALQLYRAIERHLPDRQNMGYFEAFMPDWQIRPNKLLGPTPAPKTFNTLFHLFEAYGALLEVWPDPTLRSQAETLAMLLIERTLDRQRNTFWQMMKADWRSMDPGLSNGHDIQAAWFLPSVADRLLPLIAEPVRKAVAGIADAVLARAVEADGGVATGYLAHNGLIGEDKLWWVQAEGLVGFLDAFERRGEARFLDAAENVWRFIERSVIDRAGGEWHQAIAPAGMPRAHLPKADLWKCPYHNTRACLETIDRATRLAGRRQAAS